MTRTRLNLLICCTLLISTTMLAMFIASPINEQIEPSSFNRAFRKQNIYARAYEFELPKGNYYFAGGTDHLAYIGNAKKPFTIITVTTPKLDTTNLRIRLYDVDSIKEPGEFRTRIDSPLFFISNGVMPEIYRGDNIASPVARRFLPDKGHYFVDAIPISRSSLMLLSYSAYSRMYQLAKRTSVDTPYFKIKHGVLTKQIDGMIDVTGNMHRDNRTHRLVYLYTYRNEFILMDTNLNVLSRQHTIDTFSRAYVKIQKTSESDESIVSSPPTDVNGKSFVYNGVLYVQSNLLARNELLQRFQLGSVIDTYDLNTGKYLNSFYIRNYNDQRLVDFRVTNNGIIALYETGVTFNEAFNTKIVDDAYENE